MSEIFGTVLAMILVTALVAGIAAAILVLARRFWPRGVTGGDAEPLVFKRALPLGPREKVCLVGYRGEVFLLGVTAGRIDLLARFEEEPSDQGDSEAGPIQG